MSFSVRLLCSCFILIVYSDFVISADLIDFFGHKLESNSSIIDNNTEFQNVVYSVSNDPTMKLLKQYNYPGEIHEVTTEDGYILTVHRVPKHGKAVVLLCHGLIASSTTWVLQGPKRDLALLLSDEGYDVWMINLRGSTLSRKHVYLDPDQDKKFWDYSFHEMGYFDMPATIDYILNLTNQKTLTYIGHSMGNAVFFVMTTMKPEYNDKIQLMHGLSPAVFVIHSPSPLFEFLLENGPSFLKSLREQNIYEILSLKNATVQLGTTLCNNNSPLTAMQTVCLSGLFLVVGVDYQQMNISLLPLIFETFPGGTSVNTLAHFLQNVKTASFRPLDYGTEENKIRYNSEHIFDYDIRKVTAPVMLYYGDGDYIVTRKDTEMLASKVPNLIGIYRVPFPLFNHLDFLIAIDGKTLLYDKIISLTNKYQTK